MSWQKNKIKYEQMMKKLEIRNKHVNLLKYFDIKKMWKVKTFEKISQKLDKIVNVFILCCILLFRRCKK